jgi:protein KTI12
MPLIILSGGPCSGKSTRAQQLHDYFQTKSMPVHIITDNRLDANAVYAGGVRFVFIVDCPWSAVLIR